MSELRGVQYRNQWDIKPVNSPTAIETYIKQNPVDDIFAYFRRFFSLFDLFHGILGKMDAEDET